MAHCSWHQRRALVRAPSLFWEPITWRNFSCNHAIASTGSKSALSSRSGVHCLGGWHKGSWSRSFIRGLTIRSSRDRFAARLKWCRVPSRRAAQRSGLTQALGIMNRHSIDRAPTRGELWAGRLLTSVLSIVSGYFAYNLWRAYVERSAPVAAMAIIASVICAAFLIFFLRSAFSKPRRPSKTSVVCVSAFVALIGCFWAWLAFSISWPDNLRAGALAVGLMTVGAVGLLRQR